MTTTSTGCDLVCVYCGRPVIGQMVWGASGPYHLVCVEPPMQSFVGLGNQSIGEYERRRLENELFKALDAYIRFHGSSDFFLVQKERTKV